MQNKILHSQPETLILTLKVGRPALLGHKNYSENYEITLSLFLLISTITFNIKSTLKLQIWNKY